MQQQTWPERRAEWMKDNPGFSTGGTALPTPELINQVETMKAINTLSERLYAMEKRIAELES